MVLHILPLILAVAGGTAAIIVAVLTIDMLVDWFRERAARLHFDPNKAAITVRDAMENGRFVIMQGIFDKSREKFDEVRTVKATRVDDEIADAHRDNQVVIWE